MLTAKWLSATRTAPKIWCTFFGLVMWIAIYVYLCADVMHYMDNAWSYEMDLTLIFYEPYSSYYPKKQVILLRLYDELGLPHTKRNNFLVGHSTYLAFT